MFSKPMRGSASAHEERAAGHSVAMGNAPKEVQLAADTVTGRCLDGGVAEVLYGLIRKYG